MQTNNKETYNITSIEKGSIIEDSQNKNEKKNDYASFDYIWKIKLYITCVKSTDIRITSLQSLSYYIFPGQLYHRQIQLSHTKHPGTQTTQFKQHNELMMLQQFET
jgi:hypothetical protein